VKTLEALGKWRCQSCGAWNGEENEARRLVAVMKAKREADEREGWRGVSRGDESGEEKEVDETGKEVVVEKMEESEGEEDVVDREVDEVGEAEEEEDGPKTRSKTKGKSSKKKS
jgi:endoplasmic reticulum junction formation protein lunapark